MTTRIRKICWRVIFSRAPQQHPYIGGLDSFEVPVNRIATEAAAPIPGVGIPLVGSD
jgi:hypothetical protein